MLTERQSYILSHDSVHNAVLCTNLSQAINVCDDTVHHNLMCGNSFLLEHLSHPNVEVIVIGDKVSKNSKITISQEAITRIKQIKCDICFLGTNAIDLEEGVSDNDWEIVQVKEAMIESAQKLVCLTIAEKLHSIQPLQICPITDIDILIAKLPPDDPLLKPYVDAAIEVL